MGKADKAGTMDGAELRRCRGNLEMTQADLAAGLGMARETIGAMERDQAPIERRTALAVRHLEHLALRGDEPAGRNDGVTTQDRTAALLAALLAILDDRYVRRETRP